MESLFKMNYFHFICPRRIDFESLNIYSYEEQQKCLQDLCRSAVNAPIIKDGNVIGYIKDCHITKSRNRLVYGGIIFNSVREEVIIGENNKLQFSALILNDRGT